MLTINADDWGGWKAATDAARQCYDLGRINAVSAMVYMEDSRRAAELASGTNLRVGLHVNFTQPLNEPNCPPNLLKHQQRIGRFLRASKYALLILNPFLNQSFRLVYQAQFEEFLRLYGRLPTHIDGHQHMHLCSNLLLQPVIPSGQRVRRSFSFTSSDKSLPNRAYRRWVDRRLARRYQLTDYFFALSQCLGGPKLQRVIELSKVGQVELMTHPEKRDEYEFLTSEQFLTTLMPVKS